MDGLNPAEVREVLISLATKVYASFQGHFCWCSRPTLTTRPEGDRHDSTCLAVRSLWDKVQPVKEDK